MKGGTRILAYEITVFLGSMPFIAFLTWRARSWGLNNRNIFFLTVYLGTDVMLFPWALRFGWIKWWILSIIVLFISLIFWPKVLVNKTKDNVLATEIKVNVENKSTQEIITQIQGNTVDTVDTVETVETESSTKVADISRLLPFEKLIDLGFQAKETGDFAQAAVYFSQALAQDLLPDLAFSLIIDCFWLWDNLGERNEALAQLRIYVQKYLPLFNAELRFQFASWLSQEDLQKKFE